MTRLRHRLAPVSAGTTYTLILSVFTAVFVLPLLLATVLRTTLGTTGEPVGHLAATWGAFFLMLTAALTLTWQITRHLGISIRDLGLAPPWARPSGLLARMDYQYQALLVFGGSLGVFLLAYGAVFLPPVLAFDAPPDAGIDGHPRTLWALAPVQAGIAVITELVLLGLIVTLAEAGRRPAWETYAVSTLARLGLGIDAGWAVLMLVPTNLAVVWLYRRTHRLTPIIAAHSTAALAQAVVAAWVSWVSGAVHPPNSRILLLPHL